MRANLKSQVRQTPLPKWKPLIPLFEAVMNSIQAVRDARHNLGDGYIRIEITREGDLFDQGKGKIQNITVIDNGIGLDDANFDSFNTSYSDLKESIGGKGIGRFTWLKAFDRVEISTVFVPKGESPQKREFVFHDRYDPDTGAASPVERAVSGTTVKLVGFREPYKSEFQGTTDQLIQRMIEHFLLILIEKDCPEIEIVDFSLRSSVNKIFEKEYISYASIHKFNINGVVFTLHGFRLSAPRQAYHKLIYAANQRSVVSDNLRDYIPNLSSRLPAADGDSFVYMAIIQSDYLSSHVNSARTDFDLATGEDADIDQESLFSEEIRRQDIREKAIECVEADLKDVIETINREKETKVRNYVHQEAPQYKVLMKYSSEFIDKISPHASRGEIESALHRELHTREVELKREGSKIIKEADKIEDYETYHMRLSNFMDRYNELGVASLAQHVMHRRIILEFLEKAISIDPYTNKFPLEEVIHQLVFPMRSTSDEIPGYEQNLWMLDERLAYHSFVASDKRLDAIPERFLGQSAKRPDLLIFDEAIVFSDTDGKDHPIGSITIVEFKRPGRDDYDLQNNPVTQSFDLVRKIREGQFVIRGRPVVTANDRIPATVYAVCDLRPSLRTVLREMDAFATPDKMGFYGFHRNNAIYFEVIDYTKLLKDAEKKE